MGVAVERININDTEKDVKLEKDVEAAINQSIHVREQQKEAMWNLLPRQVTCLLDQEVEADMKALRRDITVSCLFQPRYTFVEIRSL